MQAVRITLEVRAPRLGQEHIHTPGVQLPGDRLLYGMFTQCLQVVPAVKTPVREDGQLDQTEDRQNCCPAVTDVS